MAEFIVEIYRAYPWYLAADHIVTYYLASDRDQAVRFPSRKAAEQAVDWFYSGTQDSHLNRHRWKIKAQADACKSRVSLPLEPRPCNGLNIEISQSSPRCLNRPPADWPAGMSLRWIGSGGSPLVFGLCNPERCPA